MARIRTVKPELFRHEELHQAEVETGLPLRLAFIGLFTCCDREGRFEWRPQRMKLDVLPYDDIDFSRVLDALTTRAFLVRYACGSKEYGCIPSFTNHQVINNRERDSEIPSPNDDGVEIVQGTDSDRELTREPRVNHATLETHKGNMEGEWEYGRGREVKDSRPASHPDQPAKANGHGEAVQEVFSYWCQAMGKNSLTKLTKDRKAKIQARLKEGYNVDHIKQAIDGCASSTHHMGQNDAGTVYDDLTLICRTGSKLEWFAKSVGSKQPVTKGGPETMDQFKERNRAQAERVMASGMLDDLPPERD